MFNLRHSLSLLTLEVQQIGQIFQAKSMGILWHCLLSETYLKHAVVIYLNFRVKFTVMT